MKIMARMEIHCRHHTVPVSDCVTCELLRDAEQKLVHLHNLRQEIFNFLEEQLKQKNFIITEIK